MGIFSIEGKAKLRGIDRVDQRLVDILERAAALSEYDVTLFSGKRSGDPKKSRHNTGNAVDIVLTDPRTGERIPNLKSAGAFPIYEGFARLARQVQMKQYPDLSDQFRWGGYFAGGVNRPGAIDLMHFDIKPGAPMAGGSWETGLTPAQAAIVAKVGAGRVFGSDGTPRAPAEWADPQNYAKRGFPTTSTTPLRMADVEGPAGRPAALGFAPPDDMAARDFISAAVQTPRGMRVLPRMNPRHERLTADRQYPIGGEPPLPSPARRRRPSLQRDAANTADRPSGRVPAPDSDTSRSVDPGAAQRFSPHGEAFRKLSPIPQDFRLGPDRRGPGFLHGRAAGPRPERAATAAAHAAPALWRHAMAMALLGGTPPVNIDPALLRRIRALRRG